MRVDRVSLLNKAGESLIICEIDNDQKVDLANYLRKLAKDIEEDVNINMKVVTG